MDLMELIFKLKPKIHTKEELLKEFKDAKIANTLVFLLFEISLLLPAFALGLGFDLLVIIAYTVPMILLMGVISLEMMIRRRLISFTYEIMYGRE